MSLYVCHESALKYWVTKTGDECVPDRVDVRTLTQASARMADVKLARIPQTYSEKQPLHVLVQNRRETHELKSVVPHVWGGPIAPGSFCELADANCVSSPEFTYLQMAASLSVVETVRCGCYLCSGFAIGERGYGYAGAREPLVSPVDLGSYLAAVPGSYGVAKAREALCYVVPRAASPMEVVLGMAYSLPPRLGGWDMPAIEANERIDVTERLRILVGSSHVVSDLYFPSVRGDIEFDSYAYHTGRFRLDHTQARRNVLEAMGVKTISCTWGQINTFEKFEAFTWMVKERFGIKQRAFTTEERAAQMELYDLLTNPHFPLFSDWCGSDGDLSVVFRDQLE